jgi:hypothetical protein
LLFALYFTHCCGRRLTFTLFFPATGKAASRASAAALYCELQKLPEGVSAVAAVLKLVSSPCSIALPERANIALSFHQYLSEGRNHFEYVINSV